MRFLRASAKTILWVGLAAPLVLVVLKREAIYDWWRLRGYSPPPAIAALAAQGTMTPLSQHLFYINRPQLVASDSLFRQNCPNSEQTIVLGCYLGGQRGIYIYDVLDTRLAGVEQVTAAHEMLHSAYERLSNEQRKTIDKLLSDYYKNELRDQRVIDTINNYKKTEPYTLVDEMHSVFGTEIASLPVALESYYARYFGNRSAVVVFAQSYGGEFTSRVNQINTYDSQLTTMRQNIDQREQNLSEQLAGIESDKTRLDSLRSTGQLAQYNAEVDNFNNRVDTYNRGITQLQRDIKTYNRLIEKRNQLAAELRGLQDALDTRLSTRQTR